jgi:hypothetical protein
MPLGNLFGQQTDKLLGRRTGADAQPHAVFDMRQRRPRGFDFQSFCVHSPASFCARPSTLVARNKQRCAQGERPLNAG